MVKAQDDSLSTMNINSASPNTVNKKKVENSFRK